MATGKLTPKQQAFVAEYLIDLNATQACIRAGYSAKNADKIGPELLGKTRVAAAIQEAMAARMKRVNLDADYVLSRLQLVADRCIGPPDATVILDASGATKALELLGKHLNLFKEVGGKDNPLTVRTAPELTDDELVAIVSRRTKSVHPAG